MEDFLRANYLLLTYSVESLAAITGLFFYKKYKLTAAKYFIWFLVFIFFSDLFMNYISFIPNNGILSFIKGTVFERNHWWSTLYWKIGAIMFFTFFYSKILKRELFKLIIRYSSIVFLFFSISYILYHWRAYFTRFFPILSILGAIVIFLCTVFYFIEVLQSNKILTFYRSLNFYISFAIFIWWLIITPLVFYDIYNSLADWNFVFLKWEIYLFANIFMYVTFTFAFIWCRPEND